MPETLYLQHDLDILEVEDGRSYCESCIVPIGSVYDPDRFGNYEVFIEKDHQDDLVGFLCPECGEGNVCV